uniref:Bm8625 n=1 Tax=Brugia malayi TaxID=6279 RepID=A0A0J9Y9R9_BRUMA|nr:Bm8625 [Brugia malayi]
MAFENFGFNSIPSLLETIQQHIVEIDAKNEELEEKISEFEQRARMDVPNNQETPENMQQNQSDGSDSDEEIEEFLHELYAFNGEAGPNGYHQRCSDATKQQRMQ